MKEKWLFLLAIGVLWTSGLARGKKICILETEKGTLAFAMYPDVAPRTVARISELVSSGFFNGIIFHRVVADLWFRPAIRPQAGRVDQAGPSPPNFHTSIISAVQ